MSWARKRKARIRRCGDMTAKCPRTWEQIDAAFAKFHGDFYQCAMVSR